MVQSLVSLFNSLLKEAGGDDPKLQEKMIARTLPFGDKLELTQAWQRLCFSSACILYGTDPENQADAERARRALEVGGLCCCFSFLFC
jgi:hypothetical protein